MREHGVAVGPAVWPASSRSPTGRRRSSPGTEVLGSLGRVFDLIVVGRPVAGAAMPSMSALETALFESGRPILIAPPAHARRRSASNVVIAWNGSTETARTIAHGDAVSRAGRAGAGGERGGRHGAGPERAEVAQGLVRNRIAARSRHVQAQGRSVGAAILAEAAEAGADLLLKGAYTHSRLRQMIFGGATSHILGAAELPVIMAN